MVSRLAPAMIRAVAARCESLDLASGEIVFEQGDNSDDMYFVVVRPPRDTIQRSVRVLAASFTTRCIGAHHVIHCIV